MFPDYSIKEFKMMRFKQQINIDVVQYINKKDPLNQLGRIIM